MLVKSSCRMLNRKPLPKTDNLLEFKFLTHFKETGKKTSLFKASHFFNPFTTPA